jgi:hypothetical protein
MSNTRKVSRKNKIENFRIHQLPENPAVRLIYILDFINFLFLLLVIMILRRPFIHYQQAERDLQNRKAQHRRFIGHPSLRRQLDAG